MRDRVIAGLDRRIARALAVLVFDFLSRVAWLTDDDRLANDRVEIDEPLLPQQKVNLIVACRVSQRELLKCGLFVRCVMIDVHVGIALSPFHDEVEQRERLVQTEAPFTVSVSPIRLLRSGRG